VLAELDRRPAREHDDGARVEAIRVLAMAHQGGERHMTCKDLWAYLARTTTGQLVEAPGFTRHALLFAFVHGMREPATEMPDRIDVHIVLRNDDYTTREFVVWVLQTVFHKNEGDAIAIMSHVHNNGVGIAGVYTFEVAETKVTKTIKRPIEVWPFVDVRS